MTSYRQMKTSAWNTPILTGWDDDVVKPKPSLLDIMKEQQQTEPTLDSVTLPEPDVRTLGFQQLRNIQKETFTKTKMCKFRRCKKPECTFAHSIDELVPKECFFKERCKIRTCHFLHPGETKQDYLNKIL